MDFELMINSFPKLLNATVVTLKLLSLSLLFGLIIGLFFAIMRMSKNLIINKFAYGYSYLFRGTPLLVQIFIIGFLFILKIAKSKPINNPKNKDNDKSFRVITVALNNLGKLPIINSKSI